MEKRGRKPSAKRKGYFYEKQEEAVVRYINTEDVNEKCEIFNEILLLEEKVREGNKAVDKYIVEREKQSLIELGLEKLIKN